jgi:hypothetical protein
VAIKINNVTDTTIQDFFGPLVPPLASKMSHRAKTISTIIRKAKFLPVMNGKKVLLETIRHKNGMAKRPIVTPQARALLIFIPIVYHN